MKRNLHLTIFVFALITMLTFVGCGTKETPPTQLTFDTSHTQKAEEVNLSRSQEAELSSKSNSPEGVLKNKPHSPEAELGDSAQSPESQLRDKPRRSPEAEIGDTPRRSPEAELGDKRRSPESQLRDKTRRSPEADLKGKRRSPEAEQKDKPRSPEADLKPDASSPENKPDAAQLKVDVPNDSVLRLIPKTAMSVIYCPSIQELDDRINMAATELVPQAGMAPELLAQILAGAFGAGFESLAELEEIGLDLNQDFAVFMTSLDPPSLSATVHLTDPELMKQVIAEEAEGGDPIQYKGENYWSSSDGSGSFTILDNILVFSQQPEVCENVIDISKGAKPSISQNPNYTVFLANILKGTDQLAAFLDLESIIAPFGEEIKEELETLVDVIESDPSSMASAKMLDNMFGQLIELVQEVRSISATLQIEGTDVQLAPFLQFKNDGKIQNYLKQMAPDELVLLNDLPNQAYLNGSFQGNPELLFEWGMKWVEILTMDESGVSISIDSEMAKKWETILQEMKGFYESLEDEWSFSSSFDDSFIPSTLIIYKLKDEQKARTYMDEQFLEQFQNLIKLLEELVEDSSQINMYEGAYAGNSIMHNGVEIKTIIFPNFGAAFEDLPAEATTMFPQEWNWAYAFSEGQLFLSLGGTELIKSALDTKAKMSESVAENISFQKLIGKLGKENNLFVAFSPLTLAKSIMNTVAKADPNAAAELQMITNMLMGIPENYSIGFSAKVQDRGVGAKLFITLGDFKQLIHTFVMLFGMGMM